MSIRQIASESKSSEAVPDQSAASPADYRVEYRVQPLDEHSARHVLTWRYPPPLDVANPAPHDLFWLLDPACGYRGIWSADGALLAVCCLGRAAQVQGGDYRTEAALDLGLALRPDLLGHGLGLPLWQAMMSYAHQTRAPRLLRATVASRNQRALRVCLRAGFHPEHTFGGVAGGRVDNFVQLLRAADEQHASAPLGTERGVQA